MMQSLSLLVAYDVCRMVTELEPQNSVEPVLLEYVPGRQSVQEEFAVTPAAAECVIFEKKRYLDMVL